MSTGAARPSANPSGWAQRERLGHELAEDDRVQRQEQRSRARVPTASAVPAAMPEALQERRDRVAHADAGERRGEEADERDPELDDREEPAGSLTRRRTRLAPRRPSSTSCSTRLRRIDTSAISAATKTPLMATSRMMKRSSTTGDRHPVPSSGGGFGRGSRMRAGTPTASLPAGTSLVTTAPAPVFGVVAERDRRPQHRVDAEEDAARRPSSGASRPVEVRGDRARADVRPAPRSASPR